MAFVSYIPIRFADVDHAQIVYYPRFFHFFHCVFEDLFAQHLHGYHHAVVTDKVGFPVVHAEADFKRPLRFGDVLELHLGVTRLGQRSVQCHYQGYRRSDNPTTRQPAPATAAETRALAVSGEVTVACVALPQLNAQPIPQVYRDLFATLTSTSSMSHSAAITKDGPVSH